MKSKKENSSFQETINPTSQPSLEKTSSFTTTKANDNNNNSRFVTPSGGGAQLAVIRDSPNNPFGPIAVSKELISLRAAGGDPEIERRKRRETVKDIEAGFDIGGFMICIRDNQKVITELKYSDDISPISHSSKLLWPSNFQQDDSSIDSASNKDESHQPVTAISAREETLQKEENMLKSANVSSSMGKSVSSIISTHEEVALLEKEKHPEILKNSTKIIQGKSTPIGVISKSDNNYTHTEIVVNQNTTKSDSNKRKGSFLDSEEEDNTTNTNIRKRIKKSAKNKQKQREEKVAVKRKRTEELDYSSESRTDFNASDDSLEDEKCKKRESADQKPPSTPPASKYLSSSTPPPAPKRDSPNNPFLDYDGSLRHPHESSLSTPPLDYSTHKVRVHEAQHQMAYVFRGVRFPIPATFYNDDDDPNDPIGPIQPRNLLATFQQQDSDDDDDYTKSRALADSSNDPLLGPDKNEIAEDSENPFAESDEIIHIDPNDKTSKRITEYATIGKLRKNPSMSNPNSKKKAQ
ncbi:11833_t:CDS:2 [Ambispora gerdemannii]|uniref:11833_t:CDS:1 n=1 Tax=Ambispora gerdemannii TaxID=144530 RepID=A0A9N8VFF2_9GLOM|nr:11833_t:CDS:2 [Ambispora gerdemannii]